MTRGGGGIIIYDFFTLVWRFFDSGTGSLNTLLCDDLIDLEDDQSVDPFRGGFV